MPAITLEQLPEDCFVGVKDSGAGVYIVYYSDKNFNYYEYNGKRLGTLSFEKSQYNPTKLIYEIVVVEAQNGFGPLLYDVAMEVVNKLTNGRGYLKSDPSAVSKYAKNVWDKYYQRSDISKRPLDSLENEVTPTKTDNVNLRAAKEIYGVNPKLPGKDQPWYDQPLSSAYQKNINLLNSNKIIFVENKEINTDIEILNNLNESNRTTIKSREPTRILVTYIMNILKNNILQLYSNIDKNNWTPMKITDSQYPNEYIKNIKKKIDLDKINIILTPISDYKYKILTLNTASFHDRERFKETSINIGIIVNFNNFSREEIFNNLNNFIPYLRDVITHEITHSIQYQQGKDLHNKEFIFNAEKEQHQVKKSYIYILDKIYNLYLIPSEIQAYSRGLIQRYKWPELFYHELNSLFYSPIYNFAYEFINLYKDFKFVLHNPINIKLNQEYFIHTIKQFSNQIDDFRNKLLDYIKRHYKFEINYSKLVSSKEIKLLLYNELKKEGLNF